MYKRVEEWSSYLDQDLKIFHWSDPMIPMYTYKEHSIDDILRSGIPDYRR